MKRSDQKLLADYLEGEEKALEILIDRHLTHVFRFTHGLVKNPDALLELFIANPGKVVPRETLFKEVWKTSYTGDTRTLDVHISWLRQAIEKDPRNPKLLQTIRGVGYKLNV